MKRNATTVALAAIASAATAHAGGPVVAWGDNEFFQSTVPPAAGICKQVAAGGYHTVILRMDGSVACFGRGLEGQCAGVPNLGACSYVAAGAFHTVVIKATGTVVAWGNNSYGQSAVPSTLGACSKVAAGDYHTLALRTSGTVVGWGDNTYGARTVPGTLGPAKAIAAGGYHSLAVRTDGIVVGWGNNEDGQRSVPTTLGTCTQVAAGEYHSVALRTNGTVACWGENTWGQCSPPPGLAPCIDVSAGANHTVALQQNGTVACWGRSNFGQCTVPPSLPGCTQVSGGGAHTAALTSNIAKATNLQATDGTHTSRVTLTWNAASGATGYQVYRSAGNTLGVLVATTGAVTTYDDASAVQGTLYTYWIKTVSSGGVSAASVSDTGWRNVGAPTSVMATDGTSTANVTVSWAAVPNAAGYRVFRRIGTGTTTELGAPAASPFTDATASPGVLYTYTACARTAAGNSATSTADTGWRRPATPTAVAATNGTLTTGVRVTWTATVPGATSYGILRKQGAAAAVQIATPTTSPYLDTTAVAGTTYAYSVVARAPAGNSTASTTSNGLRSAVPDRPAGIQATDGTLSGKVRVSWTASTNLAVTGYRVARQLPGGAIQQVALVPKTFTSFDDTTIPCNGTVGTYSVQCQYNEGTALTAYGIWNTGFCSASGSILAGPPPSDARPRGGEAAGDAGSRGTAGAAGSAEPAGAQVAPAARAPGSPAQGGTRGATAAAMAGTPGAGTPAAGTAHDGADGAADCRQAVARIRARILELAGSGDAMAAEESVRLAALLPAEPEAEDFGGCAACRMLQGDVNLDGTVDGADVSAFLAAWQAGDRATADLDRDGIVGREDLERVLLGWRPAPR